MREPMPASYRKEWHDEKTNMRSRSPLAHAALLACLTLGAAVALPAQQAYAQGSISQTYQIGPGTLDQALNRFATQAGITLSINGELTADQRSAGLNGQFSVPDGLAQLLQGTELQAVRNANGTYSLRRIEAQTLPEVTVSASRTGVTGNALPEVVVTAGAWNGTTEGTGSYTATGPATTATRLGMSVRETPQSVSIVTRQRIDDQQLSNISDVLQNTTGFSVLQSNSGHSYTSRGFEISSMQTDGTSAKFDPGWDVGESQVNMALFDRVEVVRGATGLLTGAGEPSAAINMVRKRANSRMFTGLAALGLGSWDHYAGTVDLSTGLNANGSIRGRLVADYDSRDSFRDNQSNKRQTLFGTIDVDLTRQTTLTLGASYQKNEPKGSTGGTGLPALFADGTRTEWERSLNPGADWASRKSSTNHYFSKLETNFDNGWNLELNASYQTSKGSAKTIYMGGNPPADTGATDLVFDPFFFSAMAHWLIYEREQKDASLHARGPFQLLGREHELGAGLIYSEEEFDPSTDVRIFDFGAGNSLFNWQRPPEPEWPTQRHSDFWGGTKTGQKAAYAVSRFSLRDDLKLIAGTRVTTWNNKNRNRTHKHSAVITPYAGLVYDLSSDLSIYASYTDIFKQQEARDRFGNFLDPINGKTYELGLKGEFLQGRLNSGLTFYRIEQDNLAIADGIERVPGTTNEQAFYASRGTVSTGYEFEVSGNAARGLDFTVGYGHVFRLKDADGTDLNTHISRRTLKAFGKYKLPGALHRLSLGAGVRWQSGTHTIPETAGWSSVNQGSLYVASLMASYDITPQVSVQLNIDNLFDKKYYGRADNAAVVWGTPRSALLSLRARF